ncbi:hypothetical protein K523DRAFT_340723 [Schizophyllum commune Tattone D]|nr:hypothetical protein K523DRAFT_340723 [Schizophyllum commune Tattone D]
MALGGCCGPSPPCSQWLAASCTRPSNLSTRAARLIWRRSELNKPPRYARSLPPTCAISAATVL